MITTVGWDELLARFDKLEGRVPDAEEYQAFSALVTEHPRAAEMARLDPFSPEYRAAAMGLYLDLRGRADTTYDAARDEQSGTAATLDVWSGVPPWSFRDTRFIAEFLFSWAQIMRLLDVKPGDRVIEYGLGTGQLLLMLARAGIRSYGVDIDAPSLEIVRAQATALNLDVSLEQNVFGEGFPDETFDAVVFFEAFHHAFAFDALLRRLRDRVKPGGRIVLCGEPVVPHPSPHVPYPWGPRMDALSIFCIRRHGWMELGFTQDFLTEAFWRAGWQVEAHPFPNCGRASAYVAVRQAEIPDPALAALRAERDAADDARRRAEAERDSAVDARRRVEAERDEALALVEAFRSSTSWKVTTPLRRLAATSRGRRTPPDGGAR